MSSYRDPRNPEVVHFPGTLTAMATMGLLAIITLCILVLCLLSGPWLERLLWSIPPLLILAFIYGYWPRKIVLGERGVWQYNMAGKQNYMIPWTDIAQAELTGELGSSPQFAFARNQAVRLQSTQQNLVILHTPRHSDPERFLALAQKRIASPPKAAS